MSQAAVLSTCQIPCRLGLPSGVRDKPGACWAGGWAACWAGGRAAASIGTTRRTAVASANAKPCRISRTSFLLREFFARVGLGPPKLDAFGVIHLAFSDDLRHQKVHNQVDLALLQRCWRIGHACRVRLQVGFLLAIASPIGISKLVESRHLGIEAAAFDRRHQSRAIELGVAQVRAIRHLAVGFPAITRPAMTRLAIAFLLVKPHPIRNVGGAGWL